MDQSIISKQTILLYTTPHIGEDVLKPVLYGIEEEGLPVVIETHSGTHLELAVLASRNSALSVGIGVDEQAIVLTYKNIPTHQFIYRLTAYAQYPDSLRTLGINAARLVKGNPFVFDERLEVAF